MKLSGNQLPLPATLEEHKEYLHKIVRLKLFFLHHWLSEHPDEDFRHAIRCRVDIYRKTDANPLNWNPPELFWNSEKWLCMEERAYGIYTANKNNRDNFEAEAFEVFRPSIDARCRRDYEDSSRLDGFQCGSLRHGIGVGKNGENSFHIANAVAPHSIFDDPSYLPRCFRELMDFVEKEYGATRIFVHPTLLNSCSRWLAIFPEEWLEHLTPELEDVAWHYGFWGQFITGRGTFNEKHAAYLRRTCRFPFYPRGSWCTIAAMRRSIARWL